LAIIADRVARLLDALRDGGAVAIANAATERLAAMEPDEDASEDSIDDGGPIDESHGADGEESPDDRFSRRDPTTALRQIFVADDVVLARLRLEASLIKAIRDELGILREAQAERGEEARFLVERPRRSAPCSCHRSHRAPLLLRHDRERPGWEPRSDLAP